MELFFFQLVILLFSVVIHEVSHGLVAERLGDPTARLAGRLTLNPLKHLEWWGSFFVPVGLFLLSGGAFMFGWAKPVPYNPYNLKNSIRGGGLIALAGPLSNFVVAGVFGLIYRASLLGGSPVFASLAFFSSIVVLINISLAVFNLVPIPPLDGSKVLFALLPSYANEVRAFLERYGWFILFAFIFWGIGIIEPIILFFYRLLIGN